jgi:hypothetical protein
MRQAGRYHSHYQMLKRSADFIQLCKDPKLAAETALGPVHDFNFDAAILFSDLLFPLEAMGMGLTYDPGPKPASTSRRLRISIAFAAERPRRSSRPMPYFHAPGRADKGLIGSSATVHAAWERSGRSHENASQALAGLPTGLRGQRGCPTCWRRRWCERQLARKSSRCSTPPPARSTQTPIARMWCRCSQSCCAARLLDPATPVTYYRAAPARPTGTR